MSDNEDGQSEALVAALHAENAREAARRILRMTPAQRRTLVRWLRLAGLGITLVPFVALRRRPWASVAIGVPVVGIVGLILAIALGDDDTTEPTPAPPPMAESPTPTTGPSATATAEPSPTAPPAEMAQPPSGTELADADEPTEAAMRNVDEDEPTEPTAEPTVRPTQPSGDEPDETVTCVLILDAHPVAHVEVLCSSSPSRGSPLQGSPSSA